VRVALFVHCFFPEHLYGTETYTLELALHYRSCGVDVQVVSAIFPGEPAAGSLVSRYEFQGLPVTVIDKNQLPNTRVKDTYYQPDMRPVLRQVLRELKPDIVHVTHLINHTAALLEVTEELAIPAYATFTDFFGFCFNNKLEAADGSLCAGPSSSRSNCMACYLKEVGLRPTASALVRWSSGPRAVHCLAAIANVARKLPPWRNGPVDGLLEDLARRPDTLLSLYSAYRGAVTPTSFLRGAYERNGFAMPMSTIHFGVDIDRRAKPVRPPGHVPVIGFIGQLALHKGADVLIEAFRRLAPGSAELHIHGPLQQDPAYMASLERLAAGADVRFFGTFAKEMMREVLDGMDLLVIPSRWYENSPLVLLNALASHTPVAVSDVAGMTEFLQPGINGYAFARGSADALEHLLRRLLAQPEQLSALSLGTEYRRTPADMADDTLAVYRSNANRERTP